MSILEIIIWSIAVFGAANGIAFSTLLMPLRNSVAYKKGWVILDNGQIQGTLRTNKFMLFLAKLMHCPMCLGFWVGIIFSVVWKSPTEGNYLIDAFYGSAVAWLIYLKIATVQHSKG